VSSNDLTQTIATNAKGPAEASGGNVRARQHSLTEQIAADKHLAAKGARANGPHKSLMFSKITPPGAV
jgi:hypothetical protein